MASQNGASQDQTVDHGIDEKPKTISIGDTLAHLPECARLASLVAEAGASYLLDRSGRHTLFAPVDAAMTGVAVSDVESFLTLHLLAGGTEISDLRLTREVKTQSGMVLPVGRENDRVRVAGANLVRTDIPCTNGFIHIVDAVFPSTVGTSAAAQVSHF